MMETEQPIEKELICPAWEPISDEPAWKWIQDNVELPPDSELKRFDFELFPLAMFVISQLCHNEYLRRFTEMLSAQVGKTVTMLAYLCWKIKNRPSSVGWYTDNNINAKGDYKTKIEPTLSSCPAILPLLPSDRTKKGNTLIQFGFMNLRVMGAETKSNREGKTITEVLCDEVRNYPPGAMQQIDNRFKTITNFRRILFSSAGDMTNEPWLSFSKGSRHMGFWECPHCRHKQTFRFGREASPLYPEPRNCGGFVWDDNEVTHPSDNVYNLPELFKTIRYECENENCRYRFEEKEKLSLIRSVKFEQTNLMAQPSDVSVHCWEAYMPFTGCSWSSIVAKFLNAKVAMKQGDIGPMKVFVCETLGEPWEERGEKPLEGEILKRCGEYSRGDEFPPPTKQVKQLTCDMQSGFVHFNYSVFTVTGEKRTVERGKLLTLEEVRRYQCAKGIPDFAVGIDCAHDGKTVLRECAKFGRWVPIPHGQTPRNPIRTVRTANGGFAWWDGWVALLGDDAEEFTLSLGGVSTKTYAKGISIDSNIGMHEGGSRHVLRVSWSNPFYKSELYLRRIKGLGPKWEIYKNIEADYVKQMQVTERYAKTNAEGTIIGYEWRERGRHDDSDCEQMQLVMADINGIGK